MVVLPLWLTRLAVPVLIFDFFGFVVFPVPMWARRV